MEDVRLTLSTRTSWSKFVPHALDAEQTTRQMIELGSSEFVRFRGVVTVVVVVQGLAGSRMMTWRGAEEVSPLTS
jgi:hypothetical protein